MFHSGGIAGFIIAVTVVEYVMIAAWHRRSGGGVAPSDLLPNLLAGGFLVLALGLALVGAWWGWIALCLLGALLAHLADLRRRWR